MELRNCTRCGQLFGYTTKPICEKCAAQEEEEFVSVKDFIRENENTTVVEISDATGVSANRILRYLKEGRLQLTDLSASILQCEKCSKPILSGRYCAECAARLSAVLQSSIAPPDLKKSAGQQSAQMYTYKRNKQKNN